MGDIVLSVNNFFCFCCCLDSLFNFALRFWNQTWYGDECMISQSLFLTCTSLFVMSNSFAKFSRTSELGVSVCSNISISRSYCAGVILFLFDVLGAGESFNKAAMDILPLSCIMNLIQKRKKVFFYGWALVGNQLKFSLKKKKMPMNMNHTFPIRFILKNAYKSNHSHSPLFWSVDVA